MGLLIPEDLPLDKLPSSERRVIRTFQSTLKDSWLIIPEINLIEKDRTYEIDVLLINELQGLAVIEVKGGHLQVRDGEWYRRGQIVGPSPPRQAHDAAFTLRDQLRRHSPLLGGIHVQSAVALPDLRDFEDLADRLPPGVVAAQLFFAGDLADAKGRMEDRLWELMETSAQNRSLAADEIEAIVAFLRPTLDFRSALESTATPATSGSTRLTPTVPTAAVQGDLRPRVDYPVDRQETFAGSASNGV